MAAVRSTIFAENYDQKFLLIEELDGNVSADFLTSSIIVEQFRLKQNAGLCLVLFHNTFTHFNSICIRPTFRLSLTDLEQENRLVCIQALDLLVDTFNEDKTSVLNKMNNLRSLYLSVDAGINKLKENNVSHIYLVIENLSNLFYLNYPFESVLNLFQNLHHNIFNQEKSTFIVSSHVSDANAKHKSLIAFLKHLADINFKVSGLTTGFSFEISGNFIIEKKINPLYNFTMKKDKFFFKLEDNNVLIFDGVAPNFVK